ncbi:hypothetical protein [Streptomyces sparsogenes]|uniref:Uncharacterized protein n=1 Tax=Streptomyces sparsogenes DSM 40356 TaxID=1331668 RepID=A0A1R1S834_9ACTN|nr:hypothetical protein [Streptomyces sparsogenes]OMI34397.1 hypothetical protein SPAR_36476 [Streptomyces sparsogenes DSM 40356]
MTVTIEQIIDRYAKPLAVVADKDEAPATDVDELIDQLQDASRNLGLAHFDTDDVDAAATYLTDARTSSGREQQVLLNKADQRLRNAWDLFDEYALMV